MNTAESFNFLMYTNYEFENPSYDFQVYIVLILKYFKHFIFYYVRFTFVIPFKYLVF